MRRIISAFLGPMLWGSMSLAQVRKVMMKPDEILTVKAALGIATIIQLPETIQSAIIGDQSGFKVEYLDRAVTIKPLRWGVKTNLYLVTEKRRYNLKLLTLAQNTADYIVYIKSPEQASISTKWTTIEKSQEYDFAKLSIERVGVTASGFILIDAKISIDSTQDLRIKPEDFEVRQEGSSKVINGLFLSDTKVTKKDPVIVGLSLSKTDLTTKKSLTLEWHSRKTYSISIPAEFLWK